MMKPMILAAAASLALAACEQADPAPTRMAVKLPEKVCAQARQAVEKLVARGGFESDGKGGATMMQEAWLNLDPSARDQAAQLLGYDAACRAARPSLEQNVTIRNEYGQVLTRRVVETSVDLNPLMDE